MGFIFIDGNLLEKATKKDTVKYDYTTDNRLKGVYYTDGSSVEYEYDAMRRKTTDYERLADNVGILQVFDSNGKLPSGEHCIFDAYNISNLCKPFVFTNYIVRSTPLNICPIYSLFC